MGIDCKLLPIESEAVAYSHSVLCLERDYDLFDKVRELPDAGFVPDDFNSFLGHVPDGSHEGEHGYGETKEDPYGDPIKCVRAGDLAKLKDAAHPTITRATLAYVAELPPTMRIAVYWC